MTKDTDISRNILRDYVDQKVFPKMKFKAIGVDRREFPRPNGQEPIAITDLTLMHNDITFEKRYFDADAQKFRKFGDELSFQDLVELEDPRATIKEILLELDLRGQFQSADDWKDDAWPEGHVNQAPELRGGFMIGDSRIDLFAWPNAVYLLFQRDLAEDQWVELYQICFWLQRSFDLTYSLDENLDRMRPESQNDILMNVRLSIRNAPLQALNRPVEPHLAAATLGQLWERYRARFQLRHLSEYDYGTRKGLDKGRKNANINHALSTRKKITVSNDLSIHLTRKELRAFQHHILPESFAKRSTQKTVPNIWRNSRNRA